MRKGTRRRQSLNSCLPPILVRILWVNICISAVLRGQIIIKAQNTDNNGTDGPRNDASLLPTIVETTNPTNPPSTTTAPTISSQPTAAITLAPTLSIQPSQSPTSTTMPSNVPTESSQPTDSMKPSANPSEVPSNAPTPMPTLTPTSAPSISASPSISFSPTISFAPSASLAPSDSPSDVPSESPSAVPSASALPSQLPSVFPSTQPSVSTAPSSVPSVSNMPSISISPSTVPSENPSAPPSSFPSAPSPEPSSFPSPMPTPEPTGQPSDTPTQMPTFTTRTIRSTAIRMILANVPGALNEEDEVLWAEITENHILQYYQEINDVQPGLLGVNVTDVYNTVVQRQIYSENGGVLELEYAQSIDYGLFESVSLPESSGRNSNGRNLNDNWDEIDAQLLFQLPFEYNAAGYVVELIIGFELDEWVEFLSISVGPTEAPTRAPSGDDGDGDGLSKRGLRAISASIVLAAVLIVAFLFFDRHRKERLRYQDNNNQIRDFDTMEYDNAGNNDDWRNPYVMSEDGDSPPSMAPNHSRMGTMDTIASNALTHETNRSNDNSIIANHMRASSDLPSTTTHSMNTSNSQGRRIPTIPISAALGRDASTNSSTGPTSHIFATPPRLPRDRHAREISVADTDITDLTFSEIGTDRDRGTDEAISTNHGDLSLPAIGGRGMWSPVHIPEEDTSLLVDNQTDIPQSQDGNDSSRRRPNAPKFPSQHMSGFQMKVEELE